MKLFHLNDIPYEPVSHNPELKKQVIIKENISCVRNLSRVVFHPGETASEHVHGDAYEIFYCIGGEAIFYVSGREVSLTGGGCIVIEPGERHSTRSVTETELVYFFAFK